MAVSGKIEVGLRYKDVIHAFWCLCHEMAVWRADKLFAREGHAVFLPTRFTSATQ